MRKIQEFLRAHCYDIAAYFISTTGLLFPRQAIAGDSQNVSAITASVTVPAVVFVSRQIPSHSSVYWKAQEDLSGVAAHGGFCFAAPRKLVVLESDRMRLDDSCF